MKKLCPRCKTNELESNPAMNSLSRRDNKTLICPDCGVDEAMSDFLGVSDDVDWSDEDDYNAF